MRASIAIGGVALVVAFASTGVWAAPSAQATGSDAPSSGVITMADAPGPQPLTALLMGDSYTAGNGARADGDPSYYGPERCMRSTNTWGEQYSRILESQGYAVTLMNRACSASTTDAVFHARDMHDSRVIVFPQLEDEASPKDDGFYATWAEASPRCTPAPASEEYFVTHVARTPLGDGTGQVTVTCDRWLAPQADALNPDVDLVLLTIGGNDAHFPDIVKSCLILANAGDCAIAVENARDYVNNDYANDLSRVFLEIERRTDGHAKIAFLAYPGLELNSDLAITTLSSGGLESYQVSRELSGLEARGRAAQQAAIDAVNGVFGAGTATFVDSVPDLFRGHEPDARGGIANPNRWMYEVFETTTRDEWYHLKPEGQRRIAELVAGYGVFGASDTNGAARDVALIVGDDEVSRIAVGSVLSDDSVWAGAQVSIIEQRRADGGIGLLRRVVVSGADPATALEALKATSRTAWRPEAEVRLPSRWNSTAQAVYVGDNDVSLGDVAMVWTGAPDGRSVTVDAHAVDVSRSPATLARAELAATGVRLRLTEALMRAEEAPHAWAGGPYVAGGRDLELSAAGSVGEGALSFRWDLDGDGVYETPSSGPTLTVHPGDVASGWVGVRVITVGGASSISHAWVSARSEGTSNQAPCVEGSGDVGKLGCETSPGTATSVGNGLPVLSRIPAHEQGDSAGEGAPQNTLAALTLVPLFIDDRVATQEGARSIASTRRHDPSRRRARQLVAREKGLARLLAGTDSRRGVCL